MSFPKGGNSTVSEFPPYICGVNETDETMNELPDEQQLFQMDKKQLQQYMKEAVPAQEDKTHFHPDQYEVAKNPALVHIRALKSEYQTKHKKQVTLQMVLIPALIIIPSAALIAFQASPELPAFWFVGAILLTLIYLWLTGKVSSYRTRNYDRLSEESLTAAEKVAQFYANKWAHEVYDIPTKQEVPWSRYSEVTVNDVRCEWDEVVDDGYILKTLNPSVEWDRK